MNQASPRRIAIVTDAYFPQVSGVATTIKATADELERAGHTVKIISPTDFKFKVPLPGYSEIKLAFFAYRPLRKTLDKFQPNAIHIAVEGPLGHAAKAYCRKRNMPFSSAYHTRFPEYIKVRTGIPLTVSYFVARRFHKNSQSVMVASTILKKELENRGFKNVVMWERGVDSNLFTPDDPKDLEVEGPIFMYMGRVATEKNIEAFLELDLPGTKYVVGDGPQRKSLEKKYPDAIFVGYKFGKELAQYVAAADVFVFPSVTDTLGLVMLEANACGVPVATYPSQASRTVIQDGVNGVVSENLREACLKALTLSKDHARQVALQNSWQKTTEQFFSNLAHYGI